MLGVWNPLTAGVRGVVSVVVCESEGENPGVWFFYQSPLKATWLACCKAREDRAAEWRELWLVSKALGPSWFCHVRAV